MVALANVALTDTFDTWRIRTNQIIVKGNDAELSGDAAFAKANAANVLAFNTGIGANAFTSATIAGANTAIGTGANTYLLSVIAGANTAVGAGANAFASATIAGANTLIISIITGANAAVGTGANTVGTSAFAKANAALANTSGVTFNGNLNISGNLGIGTGSPSTKLDVVGVIKSQGSSEWNFVNYYDTTTAAHRTHFLTQRSRSSGAVQSNDSLGGLSMSGKYDGSNYASGWNGGAEITAYATENWSANNRGTSLTFSTTLNGTTFISERMRIDSFGRVGIGTSSPSANLDVNGNIVSRATGPEGGEVILNNPDNASIGLVLDVSAADVGRIYQVRNNSLLQIGQVAGTGGAITLYTAATERMRIDASGNLGISTTSPVEKLHVVGNIVATGDITSAFSDERLKNILEPVQNATSKILTLDTFYYRPNQTALDLGLNNEIQIGVSAQQVQNVVPEVVKNAPIGDGYLTVQYERLVPLLIESIKELTDRIEKLENGIKNRKCNCRK